MFRALCLDEKWLNGSNGSIVKLLIDHQTVPTIKQ